HMYLDNNGRLSISATKVEFNNVHGIYMHTLLSYGDDPVRNPNSNQEWFVKIDGTGKLKRQSGDKLWSTSGNPGLGEGTHTLGFVDTSSTAKLTFKTKGQERMSIESSGKISIKGDQIYLTEIGALQAGDNTNDFS